MIRETKKEKVKEACKSLCAQIETVCLKSDFHLAPKYDCSWMLWLIVAITGKKLIFEKAEEMNMCNFLEELKH